MLYKLRGLYKPGSFSAIFMKRGDSDDFQFAFLQTKTEKKGSKFFPFRADTFAEGIHRGSYTNSHFI